MNFLLLERLKKLREDASLSQEKLASLMYVTRMTLAGYEQGKRSPDADFISDV